MKQFHHEGTDAVNGSLGLLVIQARNTPGRAKHGSQRETS